MQDLETKFAKDLSTSRACPHLDHPPWFSWHGCLPLTQLLVVVAVRSVVAERGGTAFTVVG